MYKNKLTIPLIERENEALVIDYQSMHKNVYMKDMDFDKNGNLICLYVISNGHEPGPVSAPMNGVSHIGMERNGVQIKSQTLIIIMIWVVYI